MRLETGRSFFTDKISASVIIYAKEKCELNSLTIKKEDAKYLPKAMMLIRIVA